MALRKYQLFGNLVFYFVCTWIVNSASSYKNRKNSSPCSEFSLLRKLLLPLQKSGPHSINSNFILWWAWRKSLKSDRHLTSQTVRLKIGNLSLDMLKYRLHYTVEVLTFVKSRAMSLSPPWGQTSYPIAEAHHTIHHLFLLLYHFSILNAQT